MVQLDFDIDNIKKNNIELLNCQVDLILRSLEFYCYTYSFIYPRSGKNISKEENLRISLVRDTYHQILSQYKDNDKNIVHKNEMFQGFDDMLKNIA